MRGNRTVVRNLISGYTWYSKMVMSVSEDSAVGGNGQAIESSRLHFNFFVLRL